MISKLSKQYWELSVEYYQTSQTFNIYDFNNLINKLKNVEKQLINEYNNRINLEIEEIWLKDMFYFENKINLNNYEKFYLLDIKQKIIEYRNFLGKHLIQYQQTYKKIESEIEELMYYIKELKQGLTSLLCTCKNNNVFMIEFLINKHYLKKLILRKLELKHELNKIEEIRINKIIEINKIIY